MKTVVFRHTNHSDRLGSLAWVLEKKGLPYHYIDCFDEGPGSFDPLDPGLLIVTGGAPGVYQTDLYPFLKEEMAILEKRLARDLPTFGICLGSQLMAAALGANVRPGSKGVERGWHPLRVNDKGMKTPLRHLDAAHTMMLQWHVDTFELPKGAVRLASSDMYENQAFSYGKNALAVQFHPEGTPKMIKGNLASEAYAAARGTIDIEAMRRDTEKYGETMIAQTEKFFSEWLDQIIKSAEKRSA